MSKRSKNFRPGRVNMRFLPVVVWLAAATGVVMLFQQQMGQFEILGIAQGQAHQVQASNVGRLQELHVELFQEVKAGQLIAVLDPIIDPEFQQAQIRAERGIIEAEIKRLQAELEAERDKLAIENAGRETDLVSTYQKFSVDIQREKLRVLELRTVIEPDRIRLRELVTNVKGFMAQNPTPDSGAYYELQKIKLQHDTLEKKIQENELLLEQTKNNLAEIQEQKNQIAKLQPEDLKFESALQPIQQAIFVQEKKIEQIMVSRQPILLRAPVDGLISSIDYMPGEVILLGNPILTVAENKHRQIAAWTTEEQANVIEEDMKVKIVKRSRPAQISPGKVVYIGPTLEMVPQRLWVNLNVPQWGRRILIESQAEMKMIPGEVVGIQGLQ